MLRSWNLSIIPSLLLLVCSFAVPAAADPVITFGASAVTVSGTASRAEVVLFSVGLKREGTLGRRVQVATVLKDSDGDGVVTYPLPGPAPGSSIWVAIDLSAGTFQLTSPAARAFLGGQLPPEPQGGGVGFAASTIALAREQATVLLARPGKGGPGGAWVARARDGGAGDWDGVDNGVSQVLLGAMLPLNELPAPLAKADGDVIVRVDPERLDSSVQTVVLP